MTTRGRRSARTPRTAAAIACVWPMALGLGACGLNDIDAVEPLASGVPEGGPDTDAGGGAKGDAGPTASDASDDAPLQTTASARPFAPTSPWNTPVGPGTTWHDETALHTLPTSGTSDPTDLVAHWFVTETLRVVHTNQADPAWSIGLAAFRGRPATTLQVRAAADLKPDPANPNQVILLVDGTTVYDLAAFTVSAPLVASVGPWGKDDVVNGSGWGEGNGLTGGANAGTHACNASWLGGLITASDLGAGVIDHALALGLPGSMLASAMVPPATYYDNGANDVGPIPSGARIGVPAGTAAPAGLTAIGQIVFAAIARYGMYVVDYVGGSWPVLFTTSDVPDATMSPLYSFASAPGHSADMEKIGPLLRVVDYPTPQK